MDPPDASAGTPVRTDPPPRRRRLLRRLVLYPLAVLVAVVVVLTVVNVTTRYPPSAPQQGHLALRGATVLVGADLTPQVEATVLIRDGVIVEVGPDAEVEVPADAEVVDLDGDTLLPGLIDLHAHLGMPELDRGEEMGPAVLARLVFDVMRYVPGARRAYLAHGVTTVRSLGDEHAWITELRRMIDEGELEGPRVVAAGPVFTTELGHPIVTFGVDATSDSVRVPTTADEARQAVRELAVGDAVDLIKVVQERGADRQPLQPHSREILTAIVAEAHAHELPVAAHWGTPEDLRDLLAAGVDELQHLEARGVLDGWPEGVVESMVARDMALSPTLAVTEVAVPADEHQQLRDRAAELHTAGVRLTVGSDAAVPGVGFGIGVQRELELLVAAGLTPHEALRAATTEAAQVLGSEVVGVIEPGRAADLLAVAGDPLADVGHIRHVTAVLRDGRLVVDRRS